MAKKLRTRGHRVVLNRSAGGDALGQISQITGLDGEIIQCLPLWERSAASNHRNKDTISIEVCHEDEEGKFNEKTYKSLIKLTAFLCNYFSLDSRDVIRHYDITNKICPKYYVENEDAWDKLKSDVKKALDEY